MPSRIIRHRTRIKLLKTGKKFFLAQITTKLIRGPINIFVLLSDATTTIMYLKAFREVLRSRRLSSFHLNLQKKHCKGLEVVEHFFSNPCRYKTQDMERPCNYSGSSQIPTFIWKFNPSQITIFTRKQLLYTLSESPPPPIHVHMSDVPPTLTTPFDTSPT